MPSDATPTFRDAYILNVTVISPCGKRGHLTQPDAYGVWDERSHVFAPAWQPVRVAGHRRRSPRRANRSKTL